MWFHGFSGHTICGTLIVKVTSKSTSLALACEKLVVCGTFRSSYSGQVAAGIP